MRIYNATKRCLIILSFVTVLFFSVTTPKNSQAFSSPGTPCCAYLVQCLACYIASEISLRINWLLTVQTINSFVETEFTQLKLFYVAWLFEDHILPALQMMSGQLTTVSMQNTLLVGMFFDAKHQTETQRLLQEIRLRAHKDYHPSQGMCDFGTNVKSLAASERKAEINTHALSQRFIDRQLANANTSSARGQTEDIDSRLAQFSNTYCDLSDNYDVQNDEPIMEILCDHAGGAGAEDPARVNKDIDYTRLVSQPWTLNIDFSDEILTDDEEDVLALSSNLFGSTVFQNFIATDFLDPKDESLPANLRQLANNDFFAARSLYLGQRALLAKRGVAQNSFNAITSMKSAGTAGSREFLEAILLELGVSDGTDGGQNELLQLLGRDQDGEEIGPSYHAQMEVLTKKIYQNPDFYTNLYDKPVNIDRKKVAMQAIGLMQKFDLFKSHLRHEANISVLLELAINDLQDKTEEELQNQ